MEPEKKKITPPSNRFVIRIEAWDQDGNNLGSIIEHCSNRIDHLEKAKGRARGLWRNVYQGNKKELIIFNRNFDELFRSDNFK